MGRPPLSLCAASLLSWCCVTLATCTPGADESVEALDSSHAPGTEAGSAPVLVAQTFIWGSYDEVWSQLTRADAFGAWHSAPGLAFGTAPGDSVRWGTEDDVLYEGVLLSIEPGAGLSHSFSFTFTQRREESVVEWDIVPQGEVVWVRVRHDCTEAPETAAVITEVGWTKSLERLKTLVETGTPMPWPDDAATTSIQQ